MPAPGVQSTRSATLRRTAEDKFSSWFGVRRWRLCTERTEVREQDGVTIRYHQGEFQIDAPGVFRTPLGHPGRHGYVLQEVDPQTLRDIDGSRTAWGDTVVQKAMRAGALVGDRPARIFRERA